MIRVLLFTFMIASPSLSAAVTEAECSTIDFTDRFGPPRHQGSSAFCYAFSAADLLTEANGIKPPESVSALHVATQYINANREDRRKAFDDVVFKLPPAPTPLRPAMVQTSQEEMTDRMPGLNMREYLLYKESFAAGYTDPTQLGRAPWDRNSGYTEIAASLTRQKSKVCLESEVRSENVPFSDRTAEKLTFIGKALGRPPDFYGIRGAAASADSQCSPSQLKQLSGQFKVPEPELHRSISDWAALRILEEQESHCRNEISLRGTVHSAFMGENTHQQRAALIDKVMREKSRPIALAYDGCAIWASCKDEKTIIPHASIVVGRVWNKNKNRCDLKIRDSNGKACAPRADVDCENGYYSVEMEKVLRRTWGVQWIEKD